MRKLTLALTLSLLPLFTVVNTGLPAQQGKQQPAKRHRIAVLDFNDAAVNGGAQATPGARVDAGKGISALLTSRLVKDGTYQVIESNQIHKILVGQNLSNSNLSDPETAAKIGHILGVDAVVVGEVTQFGRDNQGEKKEGAKGESDGDKGAGEARIEVAVAITAEFIDTNTGQAIASASSRGLSQRTGKNLQAEAASTAEQASAVNMEGSDFAKTMMGQATVAAVNELARELEGESAKLPSWAPPPLRGQITDASTPNIVINVGSTAGLKVGDEMLVTRVVHVVRERVANTPVGSVEDQVGELTITSVEEDSAVGRFTGTQRPEAGDLVRPLQ
jgi:curli biogenesis system outer membrane secretion channel CsgG